MLDNIEAMSQEKSAKNFVAVALGRLVRMERESRGWTYETMSHLTKTKSQSLQAFEKANAIFHTSRAINLYEAFNTGMYPKKYSLEGLTIILSLISTIEIEGKEYVENEISSKAKLTQKEKNSAYIKGTLLVTEKLRSASNLYYRLFNGFYEQIKAEQDSFVNDIENFVVGSNFIDTLEKYILDPLGFIQDFECTKVNISFIQFFEAIPSIYFGYLNDVKRALEIFNTSKEQVYKYEKTQIDKICEVIIVGKEDVTISTMKFISKFEYLQLPSFKKAHIYGFKDLEKFVLEFGNLVNTNSNNESQQDKETLLRKFSLYNLGALEQVASTIWYDTGDSQNIFWLYKLNNLALPVVFTANVTAKGISEVTILTLGKLGSKIDSLDMMKLLTIGREPKIESDTYSPDANGSDPEKEIIKITESKNVKVITKKTRH